MSLSYRYGFINKSRANHFRLYELFDIEKLKNELDNISIDIEKLGFNIIVDYKRKPVPKDQLYEHPAFRWELVCKIKLKKLYNINIAGSFDGIHFNLYNQDGNYIYDKNLLKFIFGDENKNSTFSKDIYNAPIIIKDLIFLLEQYN